MEFLSVSRRRSSSRNDPQRRWARRNDCRSQASVFHIIGTFGIRYISQVNLGDGVGGGGVGFPYNWVTGMIVVFFRGRNCGFWSNLGGVQDGKPITPSPRAREDEFILSCLGLHPERNHNSFSVEVCSSFRGQGSGAHNPWSPLDVHRNFSNKRPPPNEHPPPRPKYQTSAPLK